MTDRGRLRRVTAVSGLYVLVMIITPTIIRFLHGVYIAGGGAFSYQFGTAALLTLLLYYILLYRVRRAVVPEAYIPPKPKVCQDPLSGYFLLFLNGFVILPLTSLLLLQISPGAVVVVGAETTNGQMDVDLDYFWRWMPRIINLVWAGPWFFDLRFILAPEKFRSPSDAEGAASPTQE